MAGQISAADGAILRGAQTVASTREELNGKLATLQSQIAAVGSNWQGPAAVAFNNLMTRWQEEARKVTGALEGFEENLRLSQRDFDTADDMQMQAFTKITSRL